MFQCSSEYLINLYLFSLLHLQVEVYIMKQHKLYLHRHQCNVIQIPYFQHVLKQFKFLNSNNDSTVLLSADTKSNFEIVRSN